MSQAKTSVKNSLVKSRYKFCWQKGYKFNTNFNTSDFVNKMLANT